MSKKIESFNDFSIKLISCEFQGKDYSYYSITINVGDCPIRFRVDKKYRSTFIYYYSKPEGFKNCKINCIKKSFKNDKGIDMFYLKFFLVSEGIFSINLYVDPLDKILFKNINKALLNTLEVYNANA